MKRLTLVSWEGTHTALLDLIAASTKYICIYIFILTGVLWIVHAETCWERICTVFTWSVAQTLQKPQSRTYFSYSDQYSLSSDTSWFSRSVFVKFTYITSKHTPASPSSTVLKRIFYYFLFEVDFPKISFKSTFPVRKTESHKRVFPSDSIIFF